jgi:hypothetical protein
MDEIEYSGGNIKEWVTYWLPIVESKMDNRLVMLLKLRHGLVDGVNHSFKSMGLLVESRIHSSLKRDNFISGTRARDLYDKAIRSLMFYVGYHQREIIS